MVAMETLLTWQQDRLLISQLFINTSFGKEILLG